MYRMTENKKTLFDDAKIEEINNTFKETRDVLSKNDKYFEKLLKQAIRSDKDEDGPDEGIILDQQHTSKTSSSGGRRKTRHSHKNKPPKKTRKAKKSNRKSKRRSRR